MNIAGCHPADGAGIGFAYSGRAVTARNNGHTVHLDFEPGNYIDTGADRYQLLGVHYHSPGEHQVNSESFAAELHLVHHDSGGNLAVVGLLYRHGEASASVQRLLDVAPEVGATAELSNGVAAVEYAPAARDYYGYAGSLTTPPCSEGVRWLVMQSVGTVSPAQTDALQAITGGPNNRPVQPIGDRVILSVRG